MQRDCGLEEVKKRCSDCDTNGGTKNGRAKWGLCSNSRSVGVGSRISGEIGTDRVKGRDGRFLQSEDLPVSPDLGTVNSDDCTSEA